MIIFCDFDGTAAETDVGDNFFQTFGDTETCHHFVQKWLRNEINSQECFIQEAATVKVTPKQLDSFCDQQNLRAGFIQFVERCKKNHWSLIMLSDGLDYYIKRILARHSIDVPIYSNHLKFINPDRIKVEFPFIEHTCGRCANCKGHHIKELHDNQTLSIYIGDGYSDRCGAKAVDVIFARRDLKKWCEEKNINFHHFDNFYTIAEKLKEYQIA